jgi:hypothetical protein
MAVKKKLDLRKPAPQPAAPATPAQPQRTLKPGMYKPGQVLDPRYMTEFEKKQLAALNWEEGAPVPGNAAELIAALQAEATAEDILPVAPDTPPLEMPKPVDISKLPAAKQEELRDALEQAGRFQEQLRANQASTVGLPASVAAAKRVADQAIQNDPQSRGFSVVDDRPARQPQPHGPAPTVIPPGPKPMGWQRAQPSEPPLAVMEPMNDPPMGELSDTGAAGMTHCPHCSWELKRPDPSTPSDDDKRTYLMAALAGPGHRFTREVEMLGGSIKVGYRELTGGEADAALTQVADDVRKNRVVGDGEWWQKLMDYRMTQAIGYIDIQGVGRVFEGVDLDEIESDDGNVTPFPALVSHLLTNVLHSESIRRAVGQGFMRFQRMCEKLESNVSEPSFWEGIGSLR